MRVEGLPPAIRQALIAAAAARVDAFRPESEAGDAAPAVATPAQGGAMVAQPSTSVSMLVALAAFEPGVERRRKQAAETDRGLKMLERLRDELEAGLASPEQLQALADWATGFAVPDEPVLAALAREVELRVRVELAKHDLTA